MGSVERAGDATSEVESGEEEIVGGGELAQHLMKSGMTRNEMLAAITNRLHAETLASLPPNVRRRIRALRSLQKDFVDIEAKFYSEVHALECKYEKLYKPLFEKRAQIVNGLYEPTDEECQNPWRDDSEEEELARAVQKAAITEGEDKNKTGDETKPAEPVMDPNVKGIPDFWYTIFRNVSMLSEMMQEHDEPILKCLQDIKVQMHEDPFGFTLEFHFAPNEYFTNTVLTKEYAMKCKPDDDNPLEFEGPEIYSCKDAQAEISNNEESSATSQSTFMSEDEHEFAQPPTRKKRNIKSAKIDDKEEEAYQFMKKATVELIQKDEFTIYGQLIAHKIRNLNSFNRLIAQQRINNMLFNLEMAQMTSAAPMQNVTEMRNVTEIPNTDVTEIPDTEMLNDSATGSQVIDLNAISEFVLLKRYCCAKCCLLLSIEIKLTYLHTIL